MLINLRNALMAGKRLPYDAEVEFLECAGTSSVFPYIDTGIVGSMDVTVSARIWRSTRSTNECAMGSWDGGNTRCWPLYFNGNKYYLGMGPLASALTEVTSEAWHDIALTKSGNTFIYTADGTVVGQASSTSTFASMRTLYIGAMNNTGNPAFFFRGRFAFVKIYVAGTLVRDYIPVRKGTVGYLYDRVSGKLFGNAGTGDFVLGPDVVPVEYIESHGTEYIDTGVIPDDVTGVEVVHTICPNNSNDNIIFGVRQDSRDTRYWSDVDWTFFDSIGWGFNTYSDRSDRFVLASSDVGRVVTNSLNYMNDRAGKIDGVAYDSSLQSKTLATISRSIYLFGANNQGAVSVMGKFKVYSAKISKGQTIANKFLPVRAGTDATSWEGAMMDVLTRRIYRNAGTGAFTYGNDLKYPIPAS